MNANKLSIIAIITILFSSFSLPAYANTNWVKTEDSQKLRLHLTKALADPSSQYFYKRTKEKTENNLKTDEDLINFLTKNLKDRVDTFKAISPKNDVYIMMKISHNEKDKLAINPTEKTIYKDLCLYSNPYTSSDMTEFSELPLNYLAFCQ